MNAPLIIEEVAMLLRQTAPGGFQFAGRAASRIHRIGTAISLMLARTIAERIARTCGFHASHWGAARLTLRFNLTRSEGISPALTRTGFLLAELTNSRTGQLALLEKRIIPTFQPNIYAAIFSKVS